MSTKRVPALIIKQWLPEWKDVFFDVNIRRRKPEPYFYQFSMPVSTLRRLSEVYRRRALKPRAEDTSIQRKHTVERSDEIREFVKGGFPWSTLSKRQRASDDFKDLRMPGWLPTAIVINILAPSERRDGSDILDEDVITIDQESDQLAYLTLPAGLDKDDWDPPVKPFEIIDGQHRLLAFEHEDEHILNYELPVVAFYNLDIAWQAYLFYVINIKPKRINQSLAFDLYPLLRTANWLEKMLGSVYREARAQELTEILWAHEDSPWKSRISMLGERKEGRVTQSAFIRSLITALMVQPRGARPGGLFGPGPNTIRKVYLEWTRTQQGAFLVYIWQVIHEAVKEVDAKWARSLRDLEVQQELDLDSHSKLDIAFVSKYSLFNTDQGIRPVLQVVNDLLYNSLEELQLTEWRTEGYPVEEIDLEAVSCELEIIPHYPFAVLIRDIAAELAHFDWRTSAMPDLNEEERRDQLAYRGASGYRELRRRLLKLLMKSQNSRISEGASNIHQTIFES